MAGTGITTKQVDLAVPSGSVVTEFRTWQRDYCHMSMSATANGPITEQDAKFIQRELTGSHPAGYGCYGVRCNPRDGVYVAEWFCSLSCD